jgi:hypothetical protein
LNPTHPRLKPAWTASFWEQRKAGSGRFFVARNMVGSYRLLANTLALSAGIQPSGEPVVLLASIEEDTLFVNRAGALDIQGSGKTGNLG